VHILVAPDKFKGSLTADAAATAISLGVTDAQPNASIDCCPIADGGEGTTEALIRALGGQRLSERVTGPLGTPILASWALLGDGTAVVESAAAAGLHLIEAANRNPLHTTTFGVGELIRAALDHGAHRIIVGLGGTGTTDGGAGMARALGLCFAPATAKGTGGELASLSALDATGLDPRLRRRQIVAACDVHNPLFGPNGAAHAFAPQKGASPSEVLKLDGGLCHWASLVAPRAPGIDPHAFGMGAAGGLAFGLAAWCGATLASGARLILDCLRFSERMRRADLVLTGEGQIDAQTVHGKAVSEVGRRGREQGIPVVALTGAERLPALELWSAGIAAAFSICDGPLSFHESQARAAALLRSRAAQIVRLWARARQEAGGSAAGAAND
jgi:glycerate kinase